MKKEGGGGGDVGVWGVGGVGGRTGHMINNGEFLIPEPLEQRQRRGFFI